MLQPRPALRLALGSCFAAVIAITSPETLAEASEPAAPPARVPGLAATPFPTQHADTRRSDYVAHPVGSAWERRWENLGASSLPQPCTTGPGARVYCTSFQEPATGRCNLHALDAASGVVLWQDRVGGGCLLDEAAWLTAPLVDEAGHVYVADSRQIASFTAGGTLRWSRAHLEALPSPSGRINAPFGLNLLPDGDLVAVTVGDGFVLAVDRASGALTAGPFDLPARKAPGNPEEPPDDFMKRLGSRGGAELLWTVSLGESDLEVDNDSAVDPRSGLLFVGSGAPAPNPTGDAALWALQRRGAQFEVAFFVPFAGPGASATTPTVSADGEFVLVGDNEGQLLAVDVPACAALPAGSACDAIARAPLGTKAGASPAVTPEGRVLIALGAEGVAAFDLARDEAGRAALGEAWRYRPGFGRLVSSVATAFPNAVLFVETRWWNPLALRHELVTLAPGDGRELGRQRVGDLANLTLASDGTLITNRINFISESLRQRRPAGVAGYRPAETP